MKEVSVITGATSGIGAAAAELLGKEYQLVIAGSNAERLDSSLKKLRNKGITAIAVLCDVSDRNQVQELACEALKQGEIGNVVHAAGVVPARFDYKAERVLEVNALGTAYMVDTFFPIMDSGSVMVNLSSTAPYTIPAFSPPVDILRLDPLTPEFFEKTLTLCNQFTGKSIGGMAYVYSKWFAADYSARNAARFGRKGVRILSVSPGNIMTPLYYDYAREASDSMLEKTPVGRHGFPEEVAELIAFLVSEKAGFMTGIDVTCDGGVVAGLTLPQIE